MCKKHDAVELDFMPAVVSSADDGFLSTQRVVTGDYKSSLCAEAVKLWRSSQRTSFSSVRMCFSSKSPEHLTSSVDDIALRSSLYDMVLLGFDL